MDDQRHEMRPIYLQDWGAKGRLLQDRLVLDADWRIHVGLIMGRLDDLSYRRR